MRASFLALPPSASCADRRRTALPSTTLKRPWYPVPRGRRSRARAPTASWNSRSTNAFVWLPQGWSSMVRADGHCPGSHGARKPLMSSKQGSGSWRSSWVGRCLDQAHGRSSEGVRDASGGDPVQPAGEADQRRGGPIGIPDPVQQACDAACVQHFPQPRQLDELLLVAAPGPAPVAPQQVAPDGAHRQALGGVGVAFGVVEDLLVDSSAGSLHPGGEPVEAYRLAGACHFHQPLAQVGQGGDEGPVGLAVPEGGQWTKQQVEPPWQA
jgi:hypothetical protein